MTGVLFDGPDDDAADRNRPRLPGIAQVLITVKAAPQPSSTYRETVCIAGLRLDRDRLGWIRLYPINFRELDRSDQFPKYSIITVPVTPAPKDNRLESWNPNTSEIVVGEHLAPWKPRKTLIEPWIGGNTCDLIRQHMNPPLHPALPSSALPTLAVSTLNLTPAGTNASNASSTSTPARFPSSARQTDAHWNHLVSPAPTGTDAKPPPAKGTTERSSTGKP